MISIVLIITSAETSNNPIVEFFSILSFVLFVFFLVLAILSVIKKTGVAKTIYHYSYFICPFGALSSISNPSSEKRQQLVNKLYLTMQNKKIARRKRTRKERSRRKAQKQEDEKRQADEQVRKQEDEKRLADEQARKQEDEKRLADEQARKQQEEQKRLADEQARKQQEEQKRLADEQARKQQVEQKRLADEQARKQQEEQKNHSKHNLLQEILVVHITKIVPQLELPRKLLYIKDNQVMTHILIVMAMELHVKIVVKRSF